MKEACDRAEFIDIKTIRLLDAAYIEEFAIQNPDVHVIHLVRHSLAVLLPKNTLSCQFSARILNV